MKIAFCLGCLFCFLVAGFVTPATTAFSQERDQVLVTNERPLTQGMVNRVIEFFEWSLTIRLSAEQKAEVQQALIDSWKKNDKTEIAGTLQILKLHSELYSLSNERLSEVRSQVRDEVLKSLREQPGDKIAMMLLSLYEASSRANSNQTANSGGRRNAPPASMRVGAGDLYGIYIATTKQLIAPGPDSPVQRGITWLPGREWITFLPGGRMLFYLPEEGLAGDLTAEAQRNSEYVGTYQVKGNTIYARWASGEEKNLTRTPDGELWEERKNYTPLPKCDGLRLDGRYAVLWNEGAARNFIRFTPDGRFEENGVLQFIAYKSLASPRERAVAEVPRGNGTYSIGGNTLQLRYSDGREVKINFYTFEEELKKTRPEVIYINSFDFRLTP